MLYKILVDFSHEYTALNVFRYITFRSFLAFFTAFGVCWWLGPRYISQLIKNQWGQSVRDDGPQTHLRKQGTPTMGGGLILLGLFVPGVLWFDLGNRMVWGVLVVTFGFGLVGFVDDALKVWKKNSKGVPGKVRLLVEFAISAGVLTFLVMQDVLPTQLYLPFFKNTSFELGWFYVAFGSLVVVGAANAVNLTDGLDGLAIGPTVVSAATFLVLAYIAGLTLTFFNGDEWVAFNVAEYLNLVHIPGLGELAVLCAALIGAGIGFLWFNTFPASIFMGDVGSLAIGGCLGTLAVLTKHELPSPSEPARHFAFSRSWLRPSALT